MTFGLVALLMELREDISAFCDYYTNNDVSDEEFKEILTRLGLCIDIFIEEASVPSNKYFMIAHAESLSEIIISYETLMKL